MADMTPEEGQDKIAKFMRRVKKAKRGRVLAEWPRRSGKSTVLRGHIKAFFKKKRKMKTQLLNAYKIKQGKLIRATTQVLLLDDYTEKLLKFIKKKRPDLLVVGIGTPKLNLEVNKELDQECEHLAFE